MRLLYSSISKARICADRLDVVEDSFDGVIEKELVFVKQSSW